MSCPFRINFDNKYGYVSARTCHRHHPQWRSSSRRQVSLRDTLAESEYGARHGRTGDFIMRLYDRCASLQAASPRPQRMFNGLVCDCDRRGVKLRSSAKCPVCGV